MRNYDFAEVEKKWQIAWEDKALYHTDMTDLEKKLYCLVMYIYPSGDRLHIGHWYNYGPTDTWARFKRMQGYNIFEPMGYDAFGLPAENYAIKKGVHPARSTEENILGIREQLHAMGAMYDWTKEINTSDPEYYRWTQWFFLLMYKNDLAYRKKAPVNWCPSCKTVLANEQVIDGHCERCESEVLQKDLEQWFFRITAYAEKLLEGLNRIDWPEKTVLMQRNWIGKSEGAWIKFPITGREEGIEVFTTRPDTLWGVTYMVLAPEHPMVERLTTEEHRKEVEAYVERTRKETEIFRTSLEKEKTGVFIGSYCINPVNEEKIPIWIADYVLLTYGTGGVMAVPGHDTRDFEFAKRFDLPICEVISPDGEMHAPLDSAYIDPGVMVRSGPFSGRPSESGIEEVTQFLEERGWGGRRTQYKLRDWLISRQRYWGAPIPMVRCDHCGPVPVPEEELPVLLPEEVEFKGTGESPLVTNEAWVNTHCPECGETARREVDTMDTFVCSSWYFLRFVNPHVHSAAFDQKAVRDWCPVDQYVGGAEHAVMHLMYARFFTKVLYDLGYVEFDEPFSKLIHQGVITNQGAKMSKSRENVVNPDRYIEEFGSDVFRLYLMFMGSYQEGGDWSDEGIHGMNRFVNRVWRLMDLIQESPPKGEEVQKSPALNRQRHHAIKRITFDTERFHFNTSISRMMELVNAIYLYVQELDPEEQNYDVLMSVLESLIQLIAPYAPHLGEELWHRLGRKGSVFNSTWPDWDEDKLQTDTVTLVVQVNGKLRSRLEVDADLDDESVRELVVKDAKIQKYIQSKEIVKTVLIRNRLVNIVVR